MLIIASAGADATVEALIEGPVRRGTLSTPSGDSVVKSEGVSETLKGGATGRGKRLWSISEEAIACAVDPFGRRDPPTAFFFKKRARGDAKPIRLAPNNRRLLQGDQEDRPLC